MLDLIGELAYTSSMSSLRVGSVKDAPRRLTSGLARESRRLLRAGFKDEAGKLALANSMEKLKFGNIESAESKAEANDLAIAQERQATIERLKLAAGGKPSLTQSSNVDPSSTSSAPSGVRDTNSSAAVGAEPPVPLVQPAGTVGVLDSPAAEASRSNDRRKAMRDALDKLTGGDKEVGNMADVEARDAKLAGRKRLADLLKTSTTGKANLQPEIDAISKSQQESRDLLRGLDSNKDTREKKRVAEGLNQPVEPVSSAPLKPYAPEAGKPATAQAADPFGRIKLKAVEPYVGPMGDPNSAKDMLAGYIREGYTAKQARAMLGGALVEERTADAKRRPNKRIWTPQLPVNEDFENTAYGKVANWFNTKVK